MWSALYGETRSSSSMAIAPWHHPTTFTPIGIEMHLVFHGDKFVVGFPSLAQAESYVAVDKRPLSIRSDTFSGNADKHAKLWHDGTKIAIPKESAKL